MSDRWPLGYLFSVGLDPILLTCIILACTEEMHKNLDKFEYPPARTVVRLKSDASTFLILVSLQNVGSNEDIHKILDEFELIPDQTTD